MKQMNGYQAARIFVYIILAVLNFMPVPIPARMTFPLAWLTLCAMYKKQWVLMAALFFSFLGDVMGWRHELIPQIAFFALAQVLYIILFCFVAPPRPSWSKPVQFILLALVISVYGAAMTWIFPHVENPVIASGVAVYAVLLLGMCYAALRHKNFWLITGAILFVISDFTLGFHLFVHPLPHSVLRIMNPYYAAQLFLFGGGQQATGRQ